MVDRIHIYVDSVHPVGGVTTWAYQVSTRLHRFDARVVTVSRTRDNTADAHLFPGPRIALYSGPNSKMHSAYANGQNDQSSQEVPFAETISCLTIPTKPTTPTLPTTPTQPTPSSGKRLSPRTKITKETKPTKPTLPTKPTILGHELVRSWDDLDEFVRQEVTKTSVFVPNYLEVGYRHAALSRVQGLPSRCIGMCHTDHPYYYDLLVRYQQIIHSFGAVSGRCKRKLCELIPHREADIYLLPYGVDIVGLKRVHLSADPVRILYSGRLVKEQKRIMDLVKVVDALDRRGCKFLFDFVGVGRDKEELIKAIEEMPKVRVLEGVSHPNMMELYQHYDILLLASETEGMSIAMLESMS